MVLTSPYIISVRLAKRLLILLLLSSCSIQSHLPRMPPETPLSERHSYLQTQLDKLLNDQQQSFEPGLSVAIVHQGGAGYRYRLSKGLARADEAGTFYIDSDTAFNIGSVAKPITAIAVMQLREQQRLALTDSVRQWLPYLPSAYENVTIHHLLSHTSGLQNRSTNIRLDRIHKLDELDNKGLIRQYIEDPRLQFAPGKLGRYVNINYVLLAEIIAQASGKTYAQFVQDNIFIPQGMASTYVFGHQATQETILATNYGRSSTTFGITFALTGAIGIFSTVNDMTLLVSGLLSGDLLSPQSLQLMTQDQSLVKVNWRDHHYAYGWFVDPRSPGLIGFFHAGSVDGYAAITWVNYKKEYALVALGNGGEKTSNLISQILKITRYAYR